MKEEVHITTERIDDFVVLLALIQQMELPSILDRQIAWHWCQQRLSWGWVASTLERVTGLDIRETDFTDDRLTMVLRHLSHEACSHERPGKPDTGESCRYCSPIWQGSGSPRTGYGRGSISPLGSLCTTVADTACSSQS